MKSKKELLDELAKKTCELIDIRNDISYYCSKQYYYREASIAIKKETSLCNRINHIKQKLTKIK